VLRTVVLVLALVAPVAHADDGPARVVVEVGKTVEREVGFAIGVRCDDPAIVAAEMRAKNEQTNVLVLTGLRAGQTLCRAGTQPSQPSVLLEVRVIAPRSAR